MDMAFLRRAQQMLGDRQPVRLDHDLLMAALAAQRTVSAAAARPQADAAPLRAADAPEDSLTELLLAGPGWRRAASQQRGCFSRAEAGRRINAP
jgi:hypothetical protein